MLLLLLLLLLVLYLVLFFTLFKKGQCTVHRKMSPFDPHRTRVWLIANSLLQSHLEGGIAADGCGLGRKNSFLFLLIFRWMFSFPLHFSSSLLSSPGRGDAESQKLPSVGI